MDETVLRSMAKWPDVPAVYGWLMLDRRGDWRLKNPARGGYERIGNAALRDFIARNYAADARGRWFFQNGPQRVFLRLAYTPLVLRVEGDGLVDHRGLPFDRDGAMLDEEGSLLILGAQGIGLLDDRDLALYVDAMGEAVRALPCIARSEVAARYAFVPDPGP